jgi:hypothetical protein
VVACPHDITVCAVYRTPLALPDRRLSVFLRKRGTEDRNSVAVTPSRPPRHLASRCRERTPTGLRVDEKPVEEHRKIIRERLSRREQIRPGRIQARTTELANLLKAGRKDAGATLVTPEDAALSGGVVVIQVPKVNQKTVADALCTKFGIGASTTGGLRLCPHIYKRPRLRAMNGVASMRDLIRVV